MRRLLGIVGLVVVVGYLLTGVTQVRPGEQAVVRRFGRVVATPGPGLWLGLPWGFERVDRILIHEPRQVKVGYDPEVEDTGQTMPAGQLLTGDLNLVNVQAVIRYRVQADRVADYLLQSGRVNDLVARAAESALAEWVSSRNVDDVLLRGQAQLPPWLVARTGARLEPYQLGIEIVAASAQLAPPDSVKPDFDDVTRAETEIQTAENRARQQALDTVRAAQIEKVRIEQETAAYERERDRLARAEAERFTKRLEQYRRLKQQNPDILAAIWWDEMGRLLTRMNANGHIDLLDNHLGADGLDITQFAPQPPR
jgi:membrane protease subunit HflK